MGSVGLSGFIGQGALFLRRDARPEQKTEQERDAELCFRWVAPGLPL